MTIRGGNIVRKIGGESIKRAKKSLILEATHDNLILYSAKKVEMIGEQGGVEYLNDYTPPPPLHVVKLDGPYDDNTGKKVSILKKGKRYSYKVIQFNRTPKIAELKNLKWANRYDNDKIITNYSHIVGSQNVSFKVRENTENTTMSVYAYFSKPTDQISIITLIEGKYPKLYISTQKTGYTIQKLYGHPAAKDYTYPYEPAVVVSTYKAYLRFFENGETKDILEFNVTRDAWYYLGEKDNKVHLLNRTFEPLDENMNLYYTEEIHFPSKAPSDCRGYFLMQNKSRKLKAEPFEVEVDIDNNPIEEKREKPTEASNVMVHIGGVYRAGVNGFLVQWLGGSLGCFSFIPSNDIYQTEELAKKASINDDYDDDSSNHHWLKITNKIKELKEQDILKRFYVIINKRKSWVKTKEIELKEVLHE